MKWDSREYDDEDDDGDKRITRERFYGKDELGEIRFGGVATKANQYCYLKEGNIPRERLQELAKEAFTKKKVNTGLIPSDGLAITQKKENFFAKPTPPVSYVADIYLPEEDR